MRTRIAAVLIALVGGISAFGGSAATQFRSATSAGRVIGETSQPGGDLRLIVEFRDTPLLARSGVSIMSTSARAAAMRAFDARFAQFATDVKAIHATTAPRVTHTFSRVFAGASVVISPDTLERVRALSYVKGVYLDRTLHADSAESDSKIRADQVWTQFGTRGKGIVVAVVDTGIDYNHPAFGGGGLGPSSRVIGGHDFVNDDDDPMDDFGHGTHVAGIIGGNGGGVLGVAPEVSFLAYKVLDSNGNGLASDILAGIERTADPNGDGNPADHADVVNLSLGGPGSADDPLSQAVDTATAAGVVFCVAAGNSGSSFYTVSSPAAAATAIAVGATDLDDNIAPFSSQGPVDGTFAIKPEVVAPGVNIVSAKAGGGTLTESGTSMATPHVAGVAALLRALHPNWSPADVKAAIVETARVLGNDVMTEGGGRVDALSAATDDLIATPSTLNMGLDDGTQATFAVTRTVTFSNRSSHAQTLALAISGNRTGLTISVDPAALNLGAGESKDVSVTVTIANDQIASPTEGSLALSGSLTVAGGATPIHVPWAAVKAATVTINYTPPNMFSALIASTKSVTVAQIQPDIGKQSGTATVPAGSYDIVVLDLPLHSDLSSRFIVVENQSVTNKLEVNLSPDMASHEVRFNAVDDQSRPLSDIRGICKSWVYLWYPTGSALAWSSVAGPSSGRYFYSTLSSRLMLLPFEGCVDPTPHALYMADFPQIHGLSADVTASVDASAWNAQHVRMRIPAGLKNPQGALVPAVTWSGPNFVFPDSTGMLLPATGDVFNGVLHLTPIQHPTMTGSGVFAIDSDSPDPNARFPQIVMRSDTIRRNGDGVIFRKYLTARPIDYVADPAETIAFDEGLLHPETTIWNDDTGQYTTTFWHGAYEEPLDYRGLDAQLRVFDAAGNVIQSGQTFIPGFPLETRGVYRFEVTTPFSVDQIAGSAKFEAQFDTRLDDNAPPGLTALRLLDKRGRSVSHIETGAAGSLFFAVSDIRAAADGGLTQLPVRSDSVTAQWTRHGGDQWQSIPCSVGTVEVGNGLAAWEALGHVPVGTTFNCNVSGVTAAGPAVIDLRLHGEDAVGNVFTYTLAPAFLVEQATRVRPVRH